MIDDTTHAQPPAGSVPAVFSVAEYIELLNVFFGKHEHRILGEICEFKMGPSGHVYFTVKDKDGSAVIDAILWKSTYARCGVTLAVGLEVILTGHANVYPKSGRLSLVCDAVELVGEGALKRQYDELKKKLEREGAFAAERKRPLPEFARRIGVITSRNGAVIHDFVNNLGRFGFDVRLMDSRVEGQVAVNDLLMSVAAMRNEDIDALVIIRGGGSLESLQAFNNEALVRAVIDFPVPVIAGIGHDQDVPLAALAADHMTSTPSLAAHLLNRSWEDAYAKLRQVAYLFDRVAGEIRRVRNGIDVAQSSVIDHTANQIGILKERLTFYEHSLRLHDPTRQLKLGYAIVRHNGKILRSVSDVRAGETLVTQLDDGSFESTVQ